MRDLTLSYMPLPLLVTMFEVLVQLIAILLLLRPPPPPLWDTWDKVQKDLRKLQKLQSRVARVITEANYEIHTADNWNELQ